MRKSLIASVAAAVGLVTLAPVTAAADDDSSSEASERRTLAEILTSDRNDFDRNPFDYDIVTQAVLAFPGLAAAAGNPDAELTVFLPNDFAFRRLAYEQTGQWIRNEEKLFNAILDVYGAPTVEAVVKYHIVVAGAPNPDAPISYRTALGADGAVLTTLIGDEPTLTVDVRGRRWWQRVALVDADTNDVNAIVIRPNVGGEASNGYAHGINRVLRPIDLP
jgi:hypothetical protein